MTILDTTPTVDEDTIVCSFCGHKDGIEGDDTIILVGTMGANICEPCVIVCARAIAAARQVPADPSNNDTGC